MSDNTIEPVRSVSPVPASVGSDAGISSPVVQSYDPNNIPLPEVQVIFEAKESDENRCNNFASFESNALNNFVATYRNIKVSSIRDDHLDRVYYYIDTNNETPLTIMKFETTTGTLLSVNGVVLSLYNFLDISHIESSEVDEKERTIGSDIRAVISKKRPDLICTTNGNIKFKILGATVPAVSMALSILTKQENDNYTSDYSTEYSQEDDDTETTSHSSSPSNSKTTGTSVGVSTTPTAELGLIRSIWKAIW